MIYVKFDQLQSFSTSLDQLLRRTPAKPSDGFLILLDFICVDSSQPQSNKCSQSGGMSEDLKASIKVAAAAVTGQLAGHPVLLGIALSCRRQADRRSRGVESNRGRHEASETARERALISDAGLRRGVAGPIHFILLPKNLTTYKCYYNQ